jgi:cysteinyl-tRNA synthetase
MFLKYLKHFILGQTLARRFGRILSQAAKLLLGDISGYTYATMNPIYLHNTLTGKKELFTPLKAGEVSMYHCGPTVYNYAHIGNFRTYVFGDLLRRVFEYNGYSIRQVMNITDVDDKTIRGSQQSGISLKEFTRKYEDIFKAELSDLHIKMPMQMPRATESVDEMISLIQTLLEKKIAYATSDGVYFSIEKSAGYGQLAQLDLCKHEDGAGSEHRVKADEYEKENPQDFALWKFHTAEDDEVSWETPFGKGRPGWHIECSAMAMTALGPTIDIHTGASDLIFPHHTNEIAQSEAVTGKTFVNVWMHAGFLNVDSKKMAKSANNFYTLPILKEKNISPLAYRYWLLTAHYRTQVNFTEESVLSAGVALGRLQDAVEKLMKEGADISDTSKSKDAVQSSTADSIAIDARGPNTNDVIAAYEKDFAEAINDDLNISKALALAWELVKEKGVADDEKLGLILKFDNVFGLGLKETAERKISAGENEAAEIAPDLKEKLDALLDIRKKAREEKNWDTSDKARDNIRALGFEVLDGESGQTIRNI